MCAIVDYFGMRSKMKFQSGTPLGQFQKMPQWCPTLENTNTEKEISRWDTTGAISKNAPVVSHL